jgi:hypothetical protein
MKTLDENDKPALFSLAVAAVLALFLWVVRK